MKSLNQPNQSSDNLDHLILTKDGFYSFADEGGPLILFNLWNTHLSNMENTPDCSNKLIRIFLLLIAGYDCSKKTRHGRPYLNVMHLLQIRLKSIINYYITFHYLNLISLLFNFNPLRRVSMHVIYLRFESSLIIWKKKWTLVL